MERSNPYLKELYMKVLENQLRDNDPPETGVTLNRLLAQGFSRDDAKEYIARAVCIEVWDVIKHKKEFNRARFIRNLEGLPGEPVI